MAIEEFWDRLAYLRSESPLQDRRHVSNRDQSAKIMQLDLWLMPRLLKDYDPDDFWFLDEDEQDRLGRAVRSYRETARRISSGSPAIDGLVRDAEAELATIRAILRCDRVPCWEAFALDRLLDRMPEPLPRWVIGRQYRAEDDSTGEPALWIHFVVDEDTLEAEPDYPSNMSTVGRIATHVYGALSARRRLYTSFGGDDTGLADEPEGSD